MTVAVADRKFSSQKKAALEKANRVKRARRRLFADLKRLARPEAMAVAADVLENNREEFAALRVDELFLSLGKPFAVRLLVKAHVAPYRTVEELSERQRELLSAELRGYEG